MSPYSDQCMNIREKGCIRLPSFPQVTNLLWVPPQLHRHQRHSYKPLQFYRKCYYNCPPFQQFQNQSASSFQKDSEILNCNLCNVKYNHVTCKVTRLGRKALPKAVCLGLLIVSSKQAWSHYQRSPQLNSSTCQTCVQVEIEGNISNAL